jgi:hypothetical protein
MRIKSPMRGEYSRATGSMMRLTLWITFADACAGTTQSHRPKARPSVRAIQGRGRCPPPMRTGESIPRSAPTVADGDLSTGQSPTSRISKNSTRCLATPLSAPKREYEHSWLIHRLPSVGRGLYQLRATRYHLYRALTKTLSAAVRNSTASAEEARLEFGRPPGRATCV